MLAAPLSFSAWHDADENLWVGLVRKLLGDLAEDSSMAAAERARASDSTDEEEELANARRELAKVDEEIRLDEGSRDTVRRVPRGLRWLAKDDAVVDAGARTFYEACQTAGTLLKRLRS